MPEGPLSLRPSSLDGLMPGCGVQHAGVAAMPSKSEGGDEIFTYAERHESIPPCAGPTLLLLMNSAIVDKILLAARGRFRAEKLASEIIS